MRSLAVVKGRTGLSSLAISGWAASRAQATAIIQLTPQWTFPLILARPWPKLSSGFSTVGLISHVILMQFKGGKVVRRSLHLDREIGRISFGILVGKVIRFGDNGVF